MELKNILLENTKKIIEEYNLLNKTENVYVGLSGGKDSVATTLLLRSLEYNVTPIIVDMSDPNFQADKIKQDIDTYGFESEIIDVCDPNFLNSLPNKHREDIKRRLEYLLDVPKGKTACTDCYNVKITAFSNFISKKGGKKVVIGQHRNDMITSMMKCYWSDLYYNEITRLTGQPYGGKIMKEFIESQNIDLEYLGKLVSKGLAATDDPIREYPLENFEIVRPLAMVKESDIKKFIEQIDYPVADSDASCRYRRRESRPFRLIVQWDLEKRLENNEKLSNHLFDFVLKGFNKDGTLKFRPRNLRNKLYPGFKPFIHKY